MHVAPGSPAQRGGVLVGDTVTGLDDATIRTTRELIDALASKVGESVQLSLQRNGAQTTSRLTVGSLQD